MRSFLLAVLEPTERFAVLRRVVFRGLPTLRPVRFLYLRVYFFLTFAPFAHFLAAALNFARHAVLPLTFLPFNWVFIQD